jgi:hypothetical protein
VMARKILKENGQVVIRSSVHWLKMNSWVRAKRRNVKPLTLRYTKY